MGIRKVLIPRSNMKDVLLEDRYVGKIEIVPVENLKEVLEHALIGGPKKQGLLGKLAAIVPKAPSYPGLPGGAVPH